MICIVKGCNRQCVADDPICPTCQFAGAPAYRIIDRATVVPTTNYEPPIPQSTIDATLAERGDRYGKFEDHAYIAQGLQDRMRAAHNGEGWNRLAADQKQALTVICDKIARMLNGDPNYRDNWHDIVGYAKLVDDRMLRDEQKTKK